MVDKGVRGKRLFRQCDVTRAIKAAKAAGLERIRVEIDRHGRIVIVETRDEVVADDIGGNEWDRIS